MTILINCQFSSTYSLKQTPQVKNGARFITMGLITHVYGVREPKNSPSMYG